jgi:ABC-type transport system involved in multi-copper enzyme maturation permease subunit
MRRLVAGELQKVLATRLWLWLLLTSMALTALYLFLAINFADNPDNPSPPLASGDGQRGVLTTGAGPAFTFLAVLAAIGVAGEFRHRTATSTFLATPHRGRVVAAKVIAYTVVGMAYAIVCVIETIAIAVPWLDVKNITVSLTDNGIPAALAGAVAAVAMFAMVGVGLGALLREQVAATVGLLSYLQLVEPIVARVSTLSEWTGYLPGQAARALTSSHQGGLDVLPAWQGGLVLVGYGLVLAVAGAFVIRRIDIT